MSFFVLHLQELFCKEQGILNVYFFFKCWIKKQGLINPYKFKLHQSSKEMP